MNQMIADALKTADAVGFEKTAPLVRDALVFREEVRAIAARLGNRYGHIETWIKKFDR